MWCSCEVTYLSLMWPGVGDLIPRLTNMWVKFVVSPCPFSRRFISKSSFLPHLKNQHFEIQIPTRMEVKKPLGGCVMCYLFVCLFPTILSGSNKKIMYFEPNFFLSLLTLGAKFTFIWKMIAFK